VRTLGTADPGYAGRVASDGRAVTLAGPDIAIWEPGSETPRMLRTGLPGAVSLALDADGSRIAVGGQVPVVGTSDNLQVWDAASGTLLRSIRSGDFTLNTVALSPDGELVAASGWDRVIRVWRVATGELVHTLRGHTSLVLTTAFSPDGGLLASGGYDAIVRTWNVATGDMLAEARGHTAPVELVAFDPTGLRVVSSSDDGTVRIWDAIDGTPGPVLRGSQGGVADARFGPTDGEVTSVGWDGVTRIWADDPDRPLATARGHGNEVWQVDVDAVGDRFATASIDHTARVWDAATGAAISTFHGHQAEVFSATMSPDGTRAVSGDTTGAVWVWDAATGDPIRQLADGLGVIRRVAFSPDGAQVAAAGDEGIWVWDAQTGAQGLALTEPSHIVAFDPEGTRLLVTDGDTEARLLDAASGSLLRALSGHTGTVTDGRFDRTGTLVVTASSEGTARVWDATTGVSLVELRAPAEAGATNSADISPDATRVVTGQDDGSVIVWDVSSGEPLVTFRGDAGQVLSVRFGPDGRRIMVAGASEAVARVFGCDLCGTTDEVVALAGSRVTRSLTEDERSRFLHEPATPASPSVGPVGSPEPTGAAGSAEPSVAPSTGMEPTPEPSPQPTAPPSPAPSPMPSVDPLGQALCAGRRESCLLAPGRYHASLFDPPLSFDVGDGWSNDYVTPRTITLSRQDGSALVTLYSAPTDGLLVGRVVAVGPGPQGLFDHLRRWYGLTVSDAVPVDVDGHPGISVDIVNRLDRDLEVLQVDEGTEYIAARGRAHWIALDVDGTTVLLTIATDEAPAGGVPPEAQALIGSLRFDPSGAGLAGGPATSPPPG